MRDFSSQPRGRRTGPTDALLLVVGVAASLMAAQAAWSAWRQLSRARDDLTEVRREAAEAADGVKRLEVRTGDRGGGLAARALLTLEAAPTRVLSDLAMRMPPDVRLDGVDLVYGDRLDLDLRVAAVEAGAYDAFLGRLGESPLFAQVVPGPEVRDRGVQASIQLTYAAPVEER
jgi:hypothetical protein